MEQIKVNKGLKKVQKLTKTQMDQDESDSTKGIKRRLKDQNDNIFLKIIEEMTEKPKCAKKRTLSQSSTIPCVKKQKFSPATEKKLPPPQRVLHKVDEKKEIESFPNQSTKRNCGGEIGLKSSLVFIRYKPSKKTVSWKEDCDLVKVSYFERDETERENVSKRNKISQLPNKDLPCHSDYFVF